MFVSHHFQFKQVRSNAKKQEEFEKLKFLLSDESLQLLPEYQQRVEVRFILVHSWNELLRCLVIWIFWSYYKLWNISIKPEANNYAN
jgi:hypothetical protein